LSASQQAATNAEPKVRRTLHIRITAPAAQPGQLLSLIRAATPIYELFGGTGVRLLQKNVDDPSRFVQVIEYEAPAALELNRQRIASDPAIQGYLQTWRVMLGGVIDMDVYQEVAEGS
jgi:hypothetical protein